MTLTMGEPPAVEPSFSFEGAELVALAEGGPAASEGFSLQPDKTTNAQHRPNPIALNGFTLVAC